jgi:glycine oxidase
LNAVTDKDCLIIGGGVIGLTLAFDLVQHGWKVRVIDRTEPGREASWAGAGILPPAVQLPSTHPYEQLCGLSHQLHPLLAAQLRQETGLETGYRRTGGIYVARDNASERGLRDAARDWQVQGIAVEELNPASLHALEPGLLPGRLSEAMLAAFHLPDEAQLRNPWHMKALLAACTARGVQIIPNSAAEKFELEGNRIRGVQTNRGLLTADRFCVASGPWSRLLMSQLGHEPAIRPIRGQMVLFQCDRPRLTRVVNEGTRYLVPRNDGRVLAGSTEEEAGFDKRTTAEGIAGLKEFAFSLVPGLAEVAVEQTWAGLRPGTADRLPYLGAVPGLTNAFIAAGHFRSGLQLSAATARVMGQLIRGETPEVDLGPFRVER